MLKMISILAMCIRSHNIPSYCQYLNVTISTDCEYNLSQILELKMYNLASKLYAIN